MQEMLIAENGNTIIPLKLNQ